MSTVIVKVDGFLAGRTRQGIRTGSDRGKHNTIDVWCTYVTVWPAVAHHTAVGLAEYGQFVRLRMIIGRVRLVAAAGRRVAAVLLWSSRLQRTLHVHGAVKAQGMVARQQHWVVEELFAGGTMEFIFHGRRKGPSAKIYKRLEIIRWFYLIKTLNGANSLSSQ